MQPKPFTDQGATVILQGQGEKRPATPARLRLVRSHGAAKGLPLSDLQQAQRGDMAAILVASGQTPEEIVDRLQLQFGQERGTFWSDAAHILHRLGQGIQRRWRARCRARCGLRRGRQRGVQLGQEIIGQAQACLLVWQGERIEAMHDLGKLLQQAAQGIGECKGLQGLHMMLEVRFNITQLCEVRKVVPHGIVQRLTQTL